eukprot:gnl/Hemi2/12864_TR4388_c0_g10_i1.p1 gnl/Hemi2/12864_TR4388_c0_g10~~gnl/Hemi2/12864_TR4388_c0_g10_i1.p1  ORF type:complete len:308 (-),score=109.38 gnl/Hemi2/12864_TR4388_c0_g10_i1:209-1096(-)
MRGTFAALACLVLLACLALFAGAKHHGHHHHGGHGSHGQHGGHHSAADLAFVGQALGLTAAKADDDAWSFPAGIGGYSSRGAVPLPEGTESIVGDGPKPRSKTEAKADQLDPNPLIQPGTAVQPPLGAGPFENNVNTDVLKQSVSTVRAMLKDSVNKGRDEIQELNKLNYSKPCRLPFPIEGSPFPRVLRCSGCISSLAALTSFMRADMNFANPQMAQYEFSQACTYVESDYIQVCQYMYNVHGRHVVSMLFMNKVPIHICSCINFCEQDDLLTYRNAFLDKDDQASAEGADVSK